MSGDTSLSFQKISGCPSPNDIKSYEYSQNSEAGDLSVYTEYCTKVTDPLSHKSELDHAEDDEPPSPLSLQQDGVFSLVQSPPFENDPTDRISPENHDHHIISELSADSKSKTLASLSEADSSVVITDQTKEPVLCSTNAWLSSDLHNASQLVEQGNSISGDIPSLPCPGNLSIINNNNNSNTKDRLVVVDSSQNSVMNSPTPNTEGPKQDTSSTTVVKQTNLSAIACRKSVKELYGQPSWWGDGDNDYSYPHTSSFRNQETFQPAFRKYSAETEVNSVSNEKSVRPPPAEAFVVDFGPPSRPRSERPASLSGSLSQCIPAKLRQGLDERERRKREKQMEVRRLSTSGVANKNTTSGPSVKYKPTPTMTTAMATSTTTLRKSSVTNVNGISKSNNRGALSSTKSSTVLRTTSTPAAGATAAAKTATSTAKTRTSTVSSIRSTATTSNKNTRLSGVSTTAGGVENRSISSSIINNNKTNSLTQRSRRIDSLSNLTVNSNTNASRSNLTDRSRGRMSNQNIGSSTREPLSTQQTSRRNTRPPFSAGGRRISTGATSLASQNTAPSQLQRSKLSSPPTRASMPPATSTGLTSSRSYLRGASSATRQASTQRRGTSRGFMTPTTSSDAKQVRARECIRSVPNESPISSSPQCDTRRIYEPSPLGNSNKKPITTTFLRRGTSQNRGGGVGATGGTIRRKLSTDNIDQYSPSNKSSSRISDLTASVVAAIEAYDDPKAYLFYRMFQGSEETERTTNGIFQAFSSYSPNFQDLSPEMNSKPLVNMNNDDEVCPDADAGNERLLTTSQMKKHLSNDDCSNGRNKCFGSTENNVEDEYDTPNRRTDSKLTSNLPHNQPYEQGNSQLSTTSSKLRKGQKDSNSSKIFPSDIQGTMGSHGLSSNHKNKVHGGVVDDAEADDDDVIDPTIKSMNISLLVSTSVTSLTPSHTGTYVIEANDETAGVDQCLSQHSDDKDVYPRKESDLLTPRGGSPLDGSEDNEQLKRLPGGYSSHQQSSRRLPMHKKGFENSMSSSVDQIQTHMPSSKLFQPTTRKKRIYSDHEVISSSTDLHKSQTADKSLHPVIQANSTVCLSEKLDGVDDAIQPDYDRVKKSALAAGGGRSRGSLEDSDVFCASSVSLTPSHTGTYVLDMDETLAAQGILPVVISSDEKALASITTDSGLATTITSSCCPESIRTYTAETVTPRGSPNIKEKLWDVVETEEGSNDEERLLVVGSNEIRGNVFSSQFPESNHNNNNRQYEVLNKCDTELDAHFAMESLRAEFEDTYKLLPSPVQFLATNAIDSSFSESESRSSQTKPTGLPIIHGKKSTRSIPLVNTTNAPAQYMSGIVKSTTQTSNSSSAASHIPVNSLQNDIVTASTCTFNNDTKYSNMRACTNDGGISQQQQTSTVGLKLPNLSSSTTSSSSNTPSTPSSSYTNNILKSKRELLEGFDFDKQDIERYLLMHNLNNNDELHSSAYHHVKRRNSEIHEYSKSMHNSTNNMIMIPSSCASDCVGDGGASGNHQYVKLLPENRIVSKRDHAVIEGVQSVNHNNNNYAVMTTATTTTSNAVRNSDTMNQLLARLHSMPTSYKSHPNKFQHILRTHSCHRRKSQYYYAHGGSASVPDPASPVRSWSSISSGTEHSLTNRIVCRTRKQLRDQTDSGFIETNDLTMKPTNSNKMLSQNFSSAFLEKKPDNLISPNAYNNRISIPQYDTDVHFRKSGEIDSRTYTRRKVSRSGDRSDPQKCLASFDAESYQAWVSRMSELARGLNSLAKEPLFQSSGSLDRENKEEEEDLHECGACLTSKSSTTVPLLNASQTIPTLPDSTTGPGSVVEVERSAFTTPLPQRSLEAMLAASNYRNLSMNQMQETLLNSTESAKIYLPVMSAGVSEKVADFIPSPYPFPLSPNFDPNTCDPNESAIYYSLMVDTIRYLSIKLRQFSDKLAHRLSDTQQQQQQHQSISGRGSTAVLNPQLSQQRRDDVQSSTKYALNDTLENMKAVNQQLQLVGKLLFSNDANNELNSQIDNATSCEYLHKLEQLNQELHRFIPIEPASAQYNTIQLPMTNTQPTTTTTVLMTASKEQVTFGSVSTTVSSNNNNYKDSTSDIQPSSLPMISSDFMKMTQPYSSSSSSSVPSNTKKQSVHQTRPPSQYHHHQHHQQHLYPEVKDPRSNHHLEEDSVKLLSSIPYEQVASSTTTTTSTILPNMNTLQTSIPPFSSTTTSSFPSSAYTTHNTVSSNNNFSKRLLLGDNIVYSTDYHLPGVTFITQSTSNNNNNNNNNTTDNNSISSISHTDLTANAMKNELLNDDEYY